MKIPIIYEDENLLVADKPPNLIVFPENSTIQKTLIDLLLEEFPTLKNVSRAPRYGIVHRLDKDTSGLLLVAKNEKTLFFLQKQFKERKVTKKYIALLSGSLKEEKGKIETLIGRSPQNRKKQKIYLPLEPDSRGKREAITKYQILKRFSDKEEKKYTLVEVSPKTGRKHQIRAHFHYLGHPLMGDKLYGFKNQPSLINSGGRLKRQFLHASFLGIKLLPGIEKEFKSELPEDLKQILKNLNEYSK